MMVPAVIMTVPTFMAPDNGVSLISKIQPSMKKAQAGLVKSSRSSAGFAVPSRPVAR